eukprot:11224759-Heterocapsa_arctica.AAC.1
MQPTEEEGIASWEPQTVDGKVCDSVDTAAALESSRRHRQHRSNHMGPKACGSPATEAGAHQH